jgi:spore germination protein GerM
MRRTFWTLLIILAVAAAMLYLFQGTDLKGNSAKVYFFKKGKLAYVKRALAEKADAHYFAVEQLLQGPTSEEKEQGFYSQVPERTKLRVIYKKGGTINADFTKELEMYGGGTTKVYGSLAQIVYTLTALKGVKDVQVLINGRREIVLGSEGLIIDKPLTRKDVSP